MKILVIGAGAIGGYFGGRLLQAGRDVTFLVRPQRADRLARSGLAIKSPTGDALLRNPGVLLAGDIKETFDLILLSCKAFDLVSAIESFAPAVGPQTLILPLLNGLKHLEMLDAHFGRSRVLGGKCMISATLDASGAVSHLSPLQSLSLGDRDDGLSARVVELKAVLAVQGIDVVASSQIVQDMWEKWVFLATLAGATCLMRASVGAILAAPGGEAFILQLLSECGTIASGAGHAPDATYLANIRKILTTPGSPATASMLRDMQGGHRIEADQIVGDLLSRNSPGDSMAPATPALQLAYCHLKAYEATRV